MNLFGVKIKSPTPRDLGLATFIILMFLVTNLVMAVINDETIKGLFPSLAAVSAGALSAACGVSPFRGWRACVLLLVISAVCYAAVQMLTGQPLSN